MTPAKPGLVRIVLSTWRGKSRIRTFSVPIWLGLKCPVFKDKLACVLGEASPEFGCFELGVARPEELPAQRMLRQAREWRVRLDAGGLTQGQLAREVGLSPARVSQVLSLLKLAHEVQEMVLVADPVEVGERGVSERRLRKLVGEDGETQVRAVRAMLEVARRGQALRLGRLARSSNKGSSVGGRSR